MIPLGPPLAGRLVMTPHGNFGAPRPGRGGTHFGIDLAAKEGDPVLASLAGLVARVGVDPLPQDGGGGGGNFVIVRSQLEGVVLELGYMHLAEQLARQGDRVAIGAVLGTAGATGTTTGGVHLHFQIVRVEGSSRTPIDPTALLPLANPPGAVLSIFGVALVTAAIGWAWMRYGAR